MKKLSECTEILEMGYLYELLTIVPDSQSLDILFNQLISIVREEKPLPVNLKKLLNLIDVKLSLWVFQLEDACSPTQKQTKEMHFNFYLNDLVRWINFLLREGLDNEKIS